MKLVTVAQMQKIEKDGDAGCLTYDQMMENAGQGLADIVLDLFLDEIEPKVVGLVGDSTSETCGQVSAGSTLNRVLREDPRRAKPFHS